MDPNNANEFVNKDAEKYWAPVDVYVGGDHAVRHLIYARFWHKVLFDLGLVHTEEPFMRLEFLGFILAEDGRKMSKRWGNVINPDDVIATFGADAFRTYEMFMGPFENTIAWSTNGLVGTRRFIERVWRISESVVSDAVPKLDVVLQQTIKKVGADIEAFKFNTAVSQMMIFLNAADEAKTIGKEQFEVFLKLLAPFAPHITEELWEQLGHTTSIHLEAWPTYDERKLVTDTVTIAIQVAGKLKGTVVVSQGAGEMEVLEAVRTSPKLGPLLAQSPGRVVFVPNRILNIIP
jgi:leucyl-tRNA synthetase